MVDLLLKNTQLFTSQDINWWTRVIVWCFYQLFELSFWRHPFTAEDPLVSKWCNAKFLQMCFDEQTNSSKSWMAWGWVNVQQIFNFWSTICLNGPKCNQISHQIKFYFWSMKIWCHFSLSKMNQYYMTKHWLNFKEYFNIFNTNAKYIQAT